MSKPKIPIVVAIPGLILLGFYMIIALHVFDARRVGNRYAEFTNRQLLRGTGGHVTYASAFYIEEGAYVVSSIDKGKENVFLNNKDDGGFPFKTDPMDYKDFVPMFEGMIVGKWPITNPVKRCGVIRVRNTNSDESSYLIGFVMASSGEGVDKTEIDFFICNTGSNREISH